MFVLFVFSEKYLYALFNLKKRQKKSCRRKSTAKLRIYIELTKPKGKK